MSNLMLEAALAYAKRGWSVIPLRPNGKQPRIDWKPYQTRHATEGELRVWWQQWPDANIGIVTGAISGIVVLDSDGSVGWEVISQQGGITETLKVSTAKGTHLYLKYPGFVVRNFARKLPELDFRGDGGYVVAPPSLHPSGAAYAWSTDPDTAPIAEMSAWLLELFEQQKRLSPQPGHSGQNFDDPPFINHIDDPVDTVVDPQSQVVDNSTDAEYWLHRALEQALIGTRNTTGFWLACQLRDLGLSMNEAETYMRQYQLRVAQPRYGHHYDLVEAMSSLQQAYLNPPRPPAQHPIGANRHNVPGANPSVAASQMSSASSAKVNRGTASTANGAGGNGAIPPPPPLDRPPMPHRRRRRGR
jgi:hypothetical protein